MKQQQITALLLTATLSGAMAPLSFSAVVLAQATNSAPINIAELVRARNYARQAAERANGGLTRYRAEQSMHGPVRQAPYVRNADGSYTFRILGYRVSNGVPESLPSLETVATVAPDGRTTIDYNGPIRN
ncbi:hypothetical protein [Thermosynechococcus vestitus]|uniref:Tlr2469 protein n=1 Tax=Thermosynechococcus vestitus (strain NIES-2133 / IAM M-273 / BP-1) TaxID=197221 RepID=Q8DG55_THEVB|nr:hypothetical protein [Thermosynechococcus vestitus]BAC10020.1 tlr2469 [Thermosynechococcus vestitus BP-1]